MAEMIERVAQALKDLASKTCYLGEDGVIDGTWDPNEFARAALVALREPTDDMLFAGHDRMEQMLGEMVHTPEVGYVLVAMIDAALVSEANGLR
jgi:hypothetical protein